MIGRYTPESKGACCWLGSLTSPSIASVCQGFRRNQGRDEERNQRRGNGSLKVVHSSGLSVNWSRCIA
jgi:hypothetical protein